MPKLSTPTLTGSGSGSGSGSAGGSTPAAAVAWAGPGARSSILRTSFICPFFVFIITPLDFFVRWSVVGIFCGYRRYIKSVTLSMSLLLAVKASTTSTWANPFATIPSMNASTDSFEVCCFGEITRRLPQLPGLTPWLFFQTI